MNTLYLLCELQVQVLSLKDLRACDIYIYIVYFTLQLPYPSLITEIQVSQHGYVIMPKMLDFFLYAHDNKVTS